MNCLIEKLAKEALLSEGKYDVGIKRINEYLNGVDKGLNSLTKVKTEESIKIISNRL